LQRSFYFNCLYFCVTVFTSLELICNSQSIKLTQVFSIVHIKLYSKLSITTLLVVHVEHEFKSGQKLKLYITHVDDNNWSNQILFIHSSSVGNRELTCK